MVENRYILHFLIFLSFNIYSQECTSLNPYNYGDCEEFIGYVWYEESCVPVYGCSVASADLPAEAMSFRDCTHILKF